VRFAAFQRQRAGGRVLEEAELDGLHRILRQGVEGWPPGVVRVAGQNQPVARHVFHHAERPAPDLVELVGGVIVPGQLCRAGDTQVNLAERIEERRIRLAQDKADRVGVPHLVAGQRAEHEAGLLGAVIRVGDAIQVSGDGLGVEGRAIVEDDIGAQGEGVGAPVGADLPA